MNSIYIDGKFYLNLYVYMESKKYEGTPLEKSILECKNIREFYKLIEPQIVRGNSQSSIKVVHDRTIYEVSPEYHLKKYMLFKNVAKLHKGTLMWYANNIFEMFEDAEDFDEAVVNIFREYGVTNFSVESIDQSIEVDRMIEYWGNKKYLQYSNFISKLIITIYSKIRR